MDGLPVTVRLHRPAAARVPARPAPTSRCRWPSPRTTRATPDADDHEAARGRAAAARAEPDAGPARRAAGHRHARPVRHAGAGDRSRRPPRGCEAGGDPRPEIMVPLVGTVQELELVRAEIEQVARRGRRRSRASTSPTRIGTMIEVPRAALTAGRIAEDGRVLLVRHQRPDPDDLGLLPRRRGGLVLLRLPREGHLRGVAVRDLDRDGVGALVRYRRRGRAARRGPTCTSASAASTAATPSRSTSSTRSGWTTCRARRSGCRSPGWRRHARRRRDAVTP